MAVPPASFMGSPVCSTPPTVSVAKGGLSAEEVEVAAASTSFQQKKTLQQPPLRIVSVDAATSSNSNVWTNRGVVQVCVVV